MSARAAFYLWLFAIVVLGGGILGATLADMAASDARAACAKAGGSVVTVFGGWNCIAGRPAQ